MIKKFLIGTFVALALLVGVTASAAYDFGPTTLKVGSSGQYVMNVQTVVGATPVDGLFGPMTKAKVMAWQASNGLVADGLVGPATKNAMNSGSYSGGSTTYPAGCTSSTGYSATTGQPCTGTTTNLPAGCTSSTGYSSTTGVKCDSGVSSSLPAGCTSTEGYSATTGAKCDSSTPAVDTGPLAGTFGTISTITQLSQYSSEEVGAGQNDIKVAGFDVKASTDGDIDLTAIKLTFDSSGNNSADSDRLVDYIDNVDIWMGSTKIGSASADDFSRDSTGVYSKTIALNGGIVRSDKTNSFYISVDAINNLDSGDIDSDSWTVGINNIRYVDGSGVSTTDSSSIPSAMDYDNAADGVAISFVSYSDATDTELKISLTSSSPATGVAKVSTTADTKGVVISKGRIILDGDSDVWLDELAVLYTTDATNVDGVTPTVYLTIDGKEFAESMTVTAGTTEAITFDDLDLTINAGDTVEFTLSADINDIEAATFAEGDYLKAEIDATRRALIVAENSKGDSLTDATEVTGTAIGNNQYFYSVAPTVSVESKSITPNDNGSSASLSATAKMKLKITAVGGTVYLMGDDETTAANEFFTIAVDGGDSSSSISSYTFSPSGTYTVLNSGADNEYYTLYEGDTMYVDIESVVLQATGSDPILAGMKGTAILFDIATPDGSTTPTGSLSFSDLVDQLKTGKTTLDS